MENTSELFKVPLAQLSKLRVGTDWCNLEIVSEVDVVQTPFGYTPAVRVKVEGKRFPSAFHISAKSLSDTLEEMRQDNGHSFVGLKFSVRKESSDRKAKYQLK